MTYGSIYSSAFYSGQADGSIKSAREIVKIVKDIFDPKSVADVGCGVGTWLKVWSDLGDVDILGIDGDWVRPDQLLIPLDKFKAMDLSAPTSLARRFDLVQSLEVAEHLPEESAEAFVSFLCSTGSLILFSAAVPHQGGANHVNEQWPEYWAELFMRNGFVAIDAIRNRVWNNPNVEWWYAQNIFLFVQAEGLQGLNGISELLVDPPQGPLARVHPRLWLEMNEMIQRPLSMTELVKMTPRSGVQFVMRAMRKLKRVIAKFT